MARDDMKELLKTASKDKWRRIGLKKRSGVLVPLFSVYSKDSVGIGDLGDIKLLVDWCAGTGNSILQLLPMNETGPTSCPYDALSSFALEPAYISLKKVPASGEKSVKASVAGLKKRFPLASGRVDYSIKSEKLKVLKEIYRLEGDPGSKEFADFKRENAYWLEDFCLFRVLKDLHGGKPWYEWDGKYKDRSREALDIFRAEREEDVAFLAWVQWKLWSQFRDAKRYAADKGILIKGDLPILISRDSADVWSRREFFRLEYAAGAPPDVYCAKGQRWGVPTYNWERIAADGYRYIKEKLRYAENFYDILRIDHVVGLFRIWSIPYDEPAESEGLKGFFDPGDERVWEEHGRNILSVMDGSTSVLLCAEDLGVIPKACPEVLKKMGMPGNEVQRWVKDWKTKHDFLKPSEYRFLSVAMLSTHDTTNWAAWWENEAGTIDEMLFMRKCADRGIDGNSAKEKLFLACSSGHGRLRWRDEVDSTEYLVNVLGKKKEELADFIDLYENSYGEKKKLWKHLKLKGAMRERPDREIVKAALGITGRSRSIFRIELITDLLYAGGILEGDPYQYRINTPGTVSANNWSLIMPVSLERLLEKVKKTGF
ncbi:MAG: 4-alpha-glucanotransferase [Candidatus Omnitrophota bacterium]